MNITEYDTSLIMYCGFANATVISVVHFTVIFTVHLFHSCVVFSPALYIIFLLLVTKSAIL